MKRSILPAALLVAVVGLAFVGKAEATPLPATLSFGYTGTVSSIADPSSVTGLHTGDTIGGTVTFDPLSDVYTTSTFGIIPFFFGTANSFAESGKFTFGAPGSPTEVDGVTGTVDSSFSFFIVPGTGLNFTFANSGGDSLALNFSGFPSFAPLLTSLTQLPADSTGVAQLLAGLISEGNGEIKYLDSTIDFSVDAGTYTPVTTPIPATLWLFASGLAGIGVLGWRRRTLGAATA